MSIALMTKVWRMDLPTTDKMVLLALADAANDDGMCWTAVCSRNHPLSGDNLFLTSGGSRGCKACRRIHKATHRSKANG